MNLIDILSFRMNLFQKPADRVLNLARAQMDELDVSQDQIDFLSASREFTQLAVDLFNPDEKIRAFALNRFAQLPETKRVIFAGIFATAINDLHRESSE